MCGSSCICHEPTNRCQITYFDVVMFLLKYLLCIYLTQSVFLSVVAISCLERYVSIKAYLYV